MPTGDRDREVPPHAGSRPPHRERRPCRDAGDDPAAPYRPDRSRRLAEVLDALRHAGFGPEEGYEWDIEASPYPGLAPFEADRAAVFFGREQEVRDLEGCLDPSREAGAVVLVAGASGTGKSSLVRAGLVPRLRRQPRWAVLGVLEPSHAFRPRLESVLGDWSASDQAPGGSEFPPAPVLVVDQAERFLVGTGPSASGESALDDLARALASVPQLHVVMVTKTADARLTMPLERWLVAKHLVVGLGRTELARVIAEPAARSGVVIDPALVSLLVEETPSGEALPLLAFTLAEIWRRRTSPTALGLADYHAVGGVTRILNDAAQSVVRSLPLQTEDEVVATMLDFVSVDATGQPISVPCRLGSFTGSRRQVVDAFIQRRLLTLKDVAHEPDPSVALTHDALMGAWGSLASAIEREREQLLLESDVRREASRGPGEWTLIAGPRLAAALRRFSGPEADQSVRSYLAACRAAQDEASAARERANRLTIQRRRWSVVAGIGVVLALVASGGVVLLQRQKTEIEALQKAASGVSLASTRRDLALTRALEAVERAPGPDTYSALLTILTTQPGPRQYLTPVGSRVYDVAWSAGREPLIGSDRGVERVDTATGARSVVIGNAGAGTAIAASSDGRVTVVANPAGVVVDVEGVTTRVAESTGTPVIAVSRDGERIAVADLTSTVRLLDAGGVEIASWRHPDVKGLAMSADGGLLASVDLSDRLTLTDMVTGRTSVATAEIPQLSRVAVSPGGQTVVAMTADGQLWRTRASAPGSGAVVDLPGQASTLAFLDDAVLAVGLTDGRIAVVEPDSGNVIATFGAHRTAVVGVSGMPDRLVSVARDGEVIVWDGIGAVPAVGEVRGQGVIAAAADAGRLTAFGEDLTLRAWRADGQALDPRATETIPEHVAVGASGQVALSTADGSVVTLGEDLEVTGQVELARPPPRVTALAWLGDRVVAGTADGEILLHEDGAPDVRARVGDGHGGVTALRAMSDGVLAWGTATGVVGTWNTADREPRSHTLGAAHDGRSVTALAFDAGRSTLYSGGDDRRTFAWHLDGAPDTAPSLVASHDDDVVGIAPLSGTHELWLATAGQDRTIRLHDLETGKAIGPALVAPGDSRYLWADRGAEGELVTLDDRSRLIVWDLSPAGLVRAACLTLMPSDAPPMCVTA